MKLKWKLLPLAFAAVGFVGCTKDVIENESSNIDGDNGNGVYVTVNVSSAFNPMTKAGETGDGDLADSEKESKIHDVNIFLIQSTDELTSNNLDIIQGTAETEIKGHGYSDEIEPATGSIEHHDMKATVMVSISDLDQRYQVLTVANAGKELSFETLGQLRDYLQATAWEKENKYDTAEKFVMATHQMWQSGVGGSDLLVTEDNTTPSNPAETTVYVERLAARVDMKLATGLSDGTANPEDQQYDKVKITGYQLVNQLKGGAYLLKRVSQTVSNVTDKLPSSLDIKYLDDEVHTSSAFNFVIDPWTVGKKVEINSSFPETVTASSYFDGTDMQNTKSWSISDLYANHFDEDLNSTIIFNLVDGIDNTAFKPLLYTQENTAGTDQQLKGFTTGMIFKGVYTPKQYSLYVEGTGSVKDDEAYVNGDFLVADYTKSGSTTRVICKDLRTIAALGFKQGTNVNIIKAIFNQNPTWTDVNQSDFTTAVNEMSGGLLIIAFQDYLKGILKKIDGQSTTFDKVQVDLTWSAFLKTKTDLSADFSQIGSRETLVKNYNIAYYKANENGDAECYYKYWIKHEPNTGNDPGVMEFSVVRNNVYQLDVTAVKDLGDPLPFTPGKDDPEDPVKEKDVYIVVNLYVKNWVIRNNGGIIL
ncbi:MAG: Mfa1 family fimbria major subunit [Parabacteroides sp.]|nr:Mfa1 family fimbria major subunit [Parabacteroides sp.]